MTILDWFLDPEHWVGTSGVPQQVLIHLAYSGAALAAALVIAVPLGAYIGYTGKGEALIVGLSNALRALPTLGLLILMVMLISPLIRSQLQFVLPSLFVLVLLAVPPILIGTYTGIQNTDEHAVGAARGMGYTNMQILWKVQLPCSLPLLLSGVRNSVLQVVSTATVAAYVSLEGLGRYILDGRASGNYNEMAAGAILLALLALALELIFIGLGRLVISPGLLRKHPIRLRKSGATLTSRALPVPVQH